MIFTAMHWQLGGSGPGECQQAGFLSKQDSLPIYGFMLQFDNGR